MTDDGRVSLRELQNLQFNTLSKQVEDLRKQNGSDHVAVRKEIAGVKGDVKSLKTTVDRWSGALAVIMALAVLIPVAIWLVNR